jgi:SHS2 domain-containing protein
MYSWVEHESEVELLVEDESPEAVFTEALVALGDLLAEERGGESVTHEVSASAADLPALLAEWLNELVYLAERDGFIPERVVRIELANASLRATVGGQRGVPQNLIKAITYHGLEMSEDEGEWRARVVLDV